MKEAANSRPVRYRPLNSYKRVGEGVEGPIYSAFLKVALPTDTSNPATAEVYAFEVGRFPELVAELQALIERCRARGVECVEVPLSGVV